MAHKFHAVPTVIEGRRFDSKAEARRWQELRLLEDAGQIDTLECQPRYVLLAAFVDATGQRHRAIEYVADFRYREAGRWIVEDVKGVETEAFKIKRKLFLARYRDVELRIVAA